MLEIVKSLTGSTQGETIDTSQLAIEEEEKKGERKKIAEREKRGEGKKSIFIIPANKSSKSLDASEICDKKVRDQCSFGRRESVEECHWYVAGNLAAQASRNKIIFNKIQVQTNFRIKVRNIGIQQDEKKIYSNFSKNVYRRQTDDEEYEKYCIFSCIF